MGVCVWVLSRPDVATITQPQKAKIKVAHHHAFRLIDSRCGMRWNRVKRMKTILLVVTCCMACAPAIRASDFALRKFGTNVFDFTPLMQAVQRGEATNTPYLVRGDVSDTGENWAYVVRKELERQLSQQFAEDLLLAGPSEQLKMLSAVRLLEKWRQGRLTPGEFMAFDPAIKRIVFDEIEREKMNYVYIRMFVTNCPPQFRVRGQQVRFCAFPAGTHTFVDQARNVQSIPRFDYGLPVENYSDDFTNVFVVTARGPVKKESPREAAAKKAAADAKLFAWRQQQASNNVAYAQYELAKQYLNGAGADKDEALGFYWLRRAAAQSYDPAMNLLKTLVEQKR
jgi:hypothetical protein